MKKERRRLEKRTQKIEMEREQKTRQKRWRIERRQEMEEMRSQGTRAKGGSK